MKKCSKCGRKTYGHYATEEDGKYLDICGICLGLPRVTDNPIEVAHEGDVIIKPDNE